MSTTTTMTTQGSNIGHGGQFGDTTYTKVFVGGLAWETQKETMKNYFQQFGDILEAVVITDKATGRSKGYGFVTFGEAESAMKACVDATPVIDGRRANCNLASLGVQRSKPSTPKHGGRKTNTRVMSGMGGFEGGGGIGAAFQSPTFPHYAIQQGIPFNNLYGYSSYSPDYTYPTSYYGLYGGAGVQYPMYGTGAANGMITGAAAATAAAAFYPYMNFGEGHGGAANYSAATPAYGIHYPHHLFQYYSGLSSPGGYPQHYATGAPISLAPPTPLQSGVSVALCAPIPHR